ncbi:MAG TPA: YIP1 family protein [Candidatus Eisenbacteria bacterium]|nr:YIP1 family protein [Candidatus Eisenbacteria bacterium]
MANFVQRMIGAATLNVPVVEEIEADTEYTVPALGVVVLASIAAAVGGFAEGGVQAAGVLLVSSLFGWVFWAFMTWLIGTKILPTPDTKSDMGELLRTMGFAQSPGLLRVFGGIPLLGSIVNWVVMIWLLVAMIVAVRQSLDYKSTLRAVVVVGIGWILNCIIFLAAMSIVGIGGMIAGS